MYIMMLMLLKIFRKKRFTCLEHFIISLITNKLQINYYICGIANSIKKNNHIFY